MKNYLRGALMLLLPALMFLSCKDDDKSGANPLLVPVNPVAQPGNGQVLLTWEAPEAEGIKGYTVTWTPNNGKVSVTDGSTSYTVTGLTNEETYTFVIKALYEQGASSGVSIKSIPKANAINYTPCTNFKAITGYKSAQLSWVAPEKIERATCTGYTISLSTVDKNEKVQYIKIDNPETTAYTVENLNNDIAYTIKITANYDNGGSSAQAVAMCTPSGPIKTVAVEGAYVHVDNTDINVYYTTTTDLKAVPLTITLHEGASKAEETFTQTLDLSTGSKTIDFKFGSQAVTYTVSGEVDLLLTALKASYDDIDAKVTIDQSKRTILVDFGTDEVDKTLIDVEMTLSKNAKPIYPAAVSDITANFSAENAAVELGDKYNNTVTYAVTCTGQAVVPGFDPSTITGKAIPSTWKRIKKYNDIALPKSIALYQITSVNDIPVDAYFVSWGRKGNLTGTHKVYSKGTTPASFETYQQMAGNAPVLLAGLTDPKGYAVSDGKILFTRPDGGTKSAFAVNKDGSWQINSCMKDAGKDYIGNYDNDKNKWDALELFAAGGLYLNPGDLSGNGYTTSAMNDSEVFFGCYAPAGPSTATKADCAGVFICKKSATTYTVAQDDICKLFISLGFNVGFDITSGNNVGVSINGKTVFAPEKDAYYAVSIQDNTQK